jgi:hypothetical protein
MLRHNQVRNLVASWAHQLGPTVIEPNLRPLGSRTFRRSTINDKENARSDVLVMEGLFGSSHRMAYIDVMVIAQEAPSHTGKTLEAVIREGETIKLRKYAERVHEVDGGDFVPFVATDAGLLGPQAHHLLQELAARIATKTNQPYGDVLRLMRTQISLTLARSSYNSLRAPRNLSQIPTVRFTATSAPYVAHLARLRRQEPGD